MLEEVLAFIRAEATPRISWRRRAWFGRRWAFRAVEAAILARGYLTNDMRIRDERRHAFAEAILDALEAVGALDLLSAGRNAEEALDDPTEGTRRLEREETGQQTPDGEPYTEGRGGARLRKRAPR